MAKLDLRLHNIVGKVLTHWLPDGVRTNEVITRVPQILYVCHNLFTCTHFATNTKHFAAHAHTVCHKCHTRCHKCHTFSHDIDYRRLRHFCDDPVCPDPILKLSTRSPPPPAGRGTHECIMTNATQHDTCTRARDGLFSREWYH